MQHKQELINYLKHGYSLLPVNVTTDGKIFPQLDEWQKRKQVNETNLLTWNVVNSWGVITGSLSNNLEVIDFDEKYRVGIFKLWKESLPKEARELLSTLPISKSKNNGYHVHYTCKTIQGNLKLAKRKADGKTTIETRGEGGFVFEYPTKGYEYIQLGSSDIKEITPEQRMVFLNTARNLSEIDEIKEVLELPNTYSSNSLPQDDTPWGDFNKKTSWEDILIPHGWKILHKKGDETYWKRPGKSENSVSASTNYKGLDLLHVFSTASEIPGEKSYNKFQIYTLYEHSNNFSTSARHLASKGYGKKIDIKKEGTIIKEDVKETKEGDKIIFRKSSDIVSKPIEWLWEGKIAKGKVSMIAGHPGLGKSQLTINLAGVVSNGTEFPGGYKCKKGKVLFFSAEDDLEDTINPRLQAVGADRDNIFLFDLVKKNGKEEFFNLSEHVTLLEDAIKSIGDVSLIIVDPITAFLGKDVDSHKNSDVRALLAVFSKLASTYSVAILMVSHLNKTQGGNAMNQISGSLAFPAAARAVYMVLKDENDESRRLFLTAKNNVANDRGGFAFRVDGCTIGNNINTSKIVWEKEAITTSLQDLMKTNKDFEGGVNKETIKWLEEYLAKYPEGKSPSEIIKVAERNGISRATLYRARDSAFVDSIPPTGKAKLWVLNKDFDEVEEKEDEVTKDALSKF